MEEADSKKQQQEFTLSLTHAHKAGKVCRRVWALLAQQQRPTVSLRAHGFNTHKAVSVVEVLKRGETYRLPADATGSSQFLGVQVLACTLTNERDPAPSQKSQANMARRKRKALDESADMVGAVEERPELCPCLTFQLGLGPIPDQRTR
jgi:hypothetical protein